MPIAQLSQIELFYDITGAENHKTAILIPGLGSQLTSWSDPFVRELVTNDFKVVRFDNRDSGLSTFIKSEVQNATELIGLLQQGKFPQNAYNLRDMAYDVVALLDHLKIEKAHLFGRSLGGIIAQIVASDFPDRVESLTVIMSTSLNPDLPPTQPEVMQLMLRPLPDFKENPELYLNQKLEFIKAISGSRYSISLEKENLVRDLERAPAANILGQLCAMAITPYNANRLHQIKAPALVIHGTEDPIFPPACGKDIAASIPNATFMEIAGMGHTLPDDLTKTIIKSFLLKTI